MTDDVAHVYELALRAFAARPGWSPRRVAETLCDDVVFVAHAGRRPIGYVALTWDVHDVLVVDQLLVAGDVQVGIADGLLDRAEQFAACERARTLRVAVDEGNWAARLFYRRRGFEPLGPGLLELVLSLPRQSRRAGCIGRRGGETYSTDDSRPRGCG